MLFMVINIYTLYIIYVLMSIIYLHFFFKKSIISNDYFLVNNLRKKDTFRSLLLPKRILFIYKVMDLWITNTTSWISMLVSHGQTS